MKCLCEFRQALITQVFQTYSSGVSGFVHTASLAVGKRKAQFEVIKGRKVFSSVFLAGFSLRMCPGACLSANVPRC